MFGSLFDEVLGIVKAWTPSKEHPTERGYRDELANYLRKELKKSSPFDDFAPRRHKIKKEHSRSLADIAVDEKVAIELKKDLRKKKDIDRLVGQLRHFKKNYDDVIIVLCGKTSEEAYDEVMELETTADLLEQRGNVAIVRKDKKKRKPEKRPWLEEFDYEF
jgi:RNA-binding protein YhbY